MGALKIGGGIVIGFFAIIIIIGILAGIGQSQNNYQVQVISNGSFSGNINVDGSGVSHDGGAGTHTYDIGQASVVSVVMQDMSGDGGITVNILNNGEVVKTASSDASYGVVNIVT